MEKELKLYLIEHKEDDIARIKQSLTDAGINGIYTIPENGEKALQSLSAVNDLSNPETPDLIIIDLFPEEGKNLIPLLKQIKANENLRQIPLIVFSANSSQELINE